MLQTIETNWTIFALALVAVLLVGWWLLSRAARTGRQRSYRPDVLDEGAAPAQRNQALIDAPSAAAAALAATGPDIFAGAGEVAAVAAAEEVAASAPAPALQANPADGDDLRRIKGVGPKLATLLASLGVTRFSQIAAWDEGDIDRMDAQLGAFAGRIRRDNWVEQCQFLSQGDTAGFEGKFGKL